MCQRSAHRSLTAQHVCAYARCLPTRPPSCLPANSRREDTHPEFGTKMRMLKQEVPIRIAVAGDTTYSGLLGPLA